MTIKRFANSAQTTLAAAVTSGATTLVVNGAGPFPSANDFYVRVDNELILVTAGAGTVNWTVTRGAESTAPAAHSAGAVVTQVLTAGVMNTLAVLTADQAPGTVLAGPASGTAAPPAFRALGAGDLPAGLGLRGIIDGLVTSRPSATTVTVAPGAGRDTTDAATLVLASAVTKTLQSSGAWAAGTGNNGLDTGARAASTWYHVWVVAQAGGASPDVLLSASATAPTMPGTYALRRRVGAVRTDGAGNLVDFVQDGDTFVWKVPLPDVVVTNPGTATVTRTLTVPTGVRVQALISVGYTAGAVSDMPSSIMVTDLSTTDTGGSFQMGSYNMYASGVIVDGGISGVVPVWTNTSAQVRTRVQLSGTNTRLIIDTFGWVDQRGRNS